MAMDAGEIERLIKARLPDAQVTIRDLAGDGDHYAATVISASFKGKSRVQQHQLVYEALKAQMGGVLHALALQTATPENLMPGDVKILSPPGAITPTGPWSLGARAGDFVFVAGMRGVDPASNTILGTEEERIRRAFTNMETIAAAEGASLASCVRLTVFVTDMKRLRPLVNKAQEELWAGGPYPPRTIVEVARLNQDDIFEVEGTFYAPK